jgi:hypothetical protein
MQPSPTPQPAQIIGNFVLHHHPMAYSFHLVEDRRGESASRLGRDYPRAIFSHAPLFAVASNQYTDERRRQPAPPSLCGICCDIHPQLASNAVCKRLSKVVSEKSLSHAQTYGAAGRCSNCRHPVSRLANCGDVGAAANCLDEFLAAARSDAARTSETKRHALAACEWALGHFTQCMLQT